MNQNAGSRILRRGVTCTNRKYVILQLGGVGMSRLSFMYRCVACCWFWDVGWNLDDA